MTLSGMAVAQIGISTANPQGAFHVDGAKDNVLTGVPTSAQQSNDFVVLKNGNVGIGTINPAAKFEIVADNQGEGSINDFTFRGFGTSKLPAIYFTGANGTYSAPTNLVKDDPIGAVTFIPRVNNNYIYTSGSRITSYYQGDGSNISTDLRLSTSGRERIRISETGNVGIGTTTPNNLLDLGTSAGKKLAIWNSVAGDDFYGFGAAQNVLQLFAGVPTDGNALMTLNKNGRVGVGTTNPQANFHAIGTRRFENATGGSVPVGSVLTATDSNGTAEWKTPASETVVGDIITGAGIDIPFAGVMTLRYTGRSITLPPGKWAVTITQLTQVVGILDTDDWMFVRSTFGEGNPALGSTATQSPDVKSPSLMSFKVQGPASPGHSQQFDVAQGIVFIENKTNAPKTYRYIVGNTVVGGSPVATTIIKSFGGTWSESSIYATAIK